MRDERYEETTHAGMESVASNNYGNSGVDCGTVLLDSTTLSTESSASMGFNGASGTDFEDSHREYESVSFDIRQTS